MRRYVYFCCTKLNKLSYLYTTNTKYNYSHLIHFINHNHNIRKLLYVLNNTYDRFLKHKNNKSKSYIKSFIFILFICLHNSLRKITQDNSKNIYLELHPYLYFDIYNWNQHFKMKSIHKLCIKIRNTFNNKYKSCLFL
jgi:hypothetical protein